MTRWAKILTFIVFTLSVAFAVMSAVTFAKREDLRKKLANEQAASAASQKQMQDKIVGLTGDLEEKSRALTETSTKLTNVNKDWDLAKAEVEREKSRIAKLEGDLMVEKNTVALQALAVKDVQERNATLVADNEKVRQENMDVNKKLGAEQDKVATLEAANRTLTTERDGLKVTLADAREMLKMNDGVFAALTARNVAWGNLITDLQTAPQIRATVLSYDPRTNTVVLNVGEKDNVRKNYEFTIFRGSDFKAKAYVIDTQPGMCGARVDVKGAKPILPGDSAWTRLE